MLGADRAKLAFDEHKRVAVERHCLEVERGTRFVREGC